jgi:hypothetical protein
MQSDFVFVAEDRGQPAQCRLLFCDFVFGKNQHVSGGRQFDGSTQAGDTGADHHEVGLRE